MNRYNINTVCELLIDVHFFLFLFFRKKKFANCQLSPPTKLIKHIFLIFAKFVNVVTFSFYSKTHTISFFIRRISFSYRIFYLMTKLLYGGCFFPSMTEHVTWCCSLPLVEHSFMMHFFLSMAK